MTATVRLAPPERANVFSSSTLPRAKLRLESSAVVYLRRHMLSARASAQHIRGSSGATAGRAQLFNLFCLSRHVCRKRLAERGHVLHSALGGAHRVHKAVQLLRKHTVLFNQLLPRNTAELRAAAVPAAAATVAAAAALTKRQRHPLARLRASTGGSGA